MKKNKRLYASVNRSRFKILLLMKLMSPLLLIFMMQLSVSAKSQDKITIRFKNIELIKAISLIEAKSDYRFVYNNNIIPSGKKIDASLRDADLPEVMLRLLNGTGLSYKMMKDNLVVLYLRDDEIKDISIKGTITDESGKLLEGASIKVKGSKTGTYTNASGEYTLSVPDNAILVISYVGYEPTEVAVGGRSAIDIKLKASSQKMDEIVVIGYGSASKRDLTGSIVKIAGKEIADKPNTNPTASLQGKVAGLSVVNSGKPGQEPDIRIRGTVSKTQTKPLYIVDGIFNDNIDYLNPADIESIEILKDPSSLAIFGVRGANGVIVVTSKKGKVGQLTVNVNSSVGTKKIVDKVSVTDAAGYKSLLDQQFGNQGTPLYPYFNLYTGNSNWAELISQNGFINTNNVSITSGTEKNKFYMGIGNTTEEGIIKHEKLQKLSLSFNDELKVSNHIKVGFNFTGYKARLPQLGDFSNALSAAPVVEPFNNANNVYNQMPFDIQSGQVDNPLRVIEEQKGQDLSDVYRAIGSVYAEISFLKKFTFRTVYSGDLAFNENRRYTPQVYMFGGAPTPAVNVINPISKVSQKSDRFSKFQQDYNLTYKNQFGEHGITLLGGFSTNFNAFTQTNGVVNQFTTGTKTPIPNDKRFWYLDNFFADPSSRNVILQNETLFGDGTGLKKPLQWEQATVSFLARALYNYKGKYLLNASFRRDGSSDVSPNNRYQNFMAVGGAWEVSKENFMSDQRIFDFLKIKASWGILGNQYTAIHYPFYPILTASSSAVLGGGVLPGYSPAFIADPNLKWETITSNEVGVEFSVLKRQLNVEVNYYNKKTKDLLTNYPSLNGQKPGITNVGEISNKGIEIAATLNKQFQNSFGYTISGNLTTLRNRVLSTYNNTPFFDGPTRSQAGDPIGSFFGYVVDGIYQNSTDSASSPNNNYLPGDFKFRDVNGDKVISPDDRTVIGNPTPKFIYGFSLGTNYKGLDFSMDFQGVSGNQIFRSWGNGAGFARLNYRTARLDAWNGDGTSNSEPILSDSRSVNRENSTYMIENGSYLRIRNIQIGYNFSKTMLSKLKLKTLRIYVSGQNLKTFKHNSGYTPEFGGSALQFGVDDGSYPVPAIYTAGINISF
jgi:TonB-linked SusC/RagA family outer membrane protein